MAAHFCPQCGQEVSSTARFCPNCGASLGTSPASSLPAMETTLDAAAQKSRRLLLPGLVVAVLVLAAALIAAGRRQPSVLVASAPPAAPSVLSAPPQPPPAAPPLTNAPTQPTSPAPAVTNAPVAPPPVLPPDVAAYLTFLQGIEQRRIANNPDVGEAALGSLMQEMMQPLMNMDSDDGDKPQDKEPSFQDKANKILSQAAQQQMILTRDFRAVQPPQACVGLANSYYALLGSYSNLTIKMGMALQDRNAMAAGGGVAAGQAAQGNVTGAFQEAAKVAAAAQNEINVDATKADSELTQLCGRYGVSKPFAISPEGASPSLLGR